MRAGAPDLPLEPGRILAALALALGTAPAWADNDLHGRLELQDAGQFASGDSLQAALGDRDANDALGTFRLTWEPSSDKWSFAFHYLLSAEDGPPVALATAETGKLQRPPATWFDLTDTLARHGAFTASQSIDRLSVAYATPDLVVRVGRQALSWGSGLVFRPMDLFDPFSPLATDTEWKPGVDMLYVQTLFPGGGDLQFILAPRPTHVGGPVTEDASSAALHLHVDLFEHETTWLLARDHGDWVAAFGVNGPLGGATWNLETVPTVLRQGGTRVSALANISDAETVLDRNATLFAEYFRNGFGVAGGAPSIATLPQDLLDRLERGQVFDTRRDYLAGGMTLEVTPLFDLDPTLIIGLDDGSALALLAATYSLGDDLTLAAGIQAPIGRSRTEFGGFPLDPANPLLLAPPGQVYLQLRRYF